MKSVDFIAMAKKAESCKTLYVRGGFGAPATAENKARYIKEYSYNTTHASEINAASSDTFFFDCCGLIKGIVWGWNADTKAQYGGAVYKSNGVSDMSANALIRACPDATEDFSNIEAGEVVWLEDHCGIYIGDGLAIECTPKWNNGVQYSAVLNVGKKIGYNSRKWTKHGHLPFIEYPKTVFEAGDTVLFKGGLIYGSYDSTFGWKEPAGVVTIASRIDNAKHPYRIGSGGYVDADTLSDDDIVFKNPTSTMQPSLPVLTKGTKGEAVKTLKLILKAHGYSVDDSIFFDDATADAVKQMQKDTGIGVDGSVGAQTWEMLISG